MKIRIKDNTVRLRLTQSEVAKLGSSGLVESVTEFIGRPFVYAIEQLDSDGLAVSFVENKITVTISRAMVDDLVETGRVGFEGVSGPVKLLVEKDFACIDNTLEDQSDNYPNPNLQC